MCFHSSNVVIAKVPQGETKKQKNKQTIMKKKQTDDRHPPGDGDDIVAVCERKSSSNEEYDNGDDESEANADADIIDDDNDDDRRDSILDIVSEIYQQDSNGKLIEEKQKYFQSTSVEDPASPSSKSDSEGLQPIHSSSQSDSKRLGYGRVPRKTRVSDDDEEAQITSIPSSSTNTSATPDPPSLRQQNPQNHQFRPPGAYSVPGMGMLQPVAQPDVNDYDDVSKEITCLLWSAFRRRHLPTHFCSFAHYFSFFLRNSILQHEVPIR